MFKVKIPEFAVVSTQSTFSYFVFIGEADMELDHLLWFLSGQPAPSYTVLLWLFCNTFLLPIGNVHVYSNGRMRYTYHQRQDRREHQGDVSGEQAGGWESKGFSNTRIAS